MAYPLYRIPLLVIKTGAGQANSYRLLRATAALKFAFIILYGSGGSIQHKNEAPYSYESIQENLIFEGDLVLFTDTRFFSFTIILSLFSIFLSVCTKKLYPNRVFISFLKKIKGLVLSLLILAWPAFFSMIVFFLLHNVVFHCCFTMYLIRTL